MKDLCYSCEKLATTKEHVPPRCLFPEQKDLPSGMDLRRNLIKVPSCPEHNLEKSSDDEYLLHVLVMNLPAKDAASLHFKTKIIRAHLRRPALISKFLEDSSSVQLRDKNSGEEFETLALGVDRPRLQRALKQVVLGIYRHHYSKNWYGNLRINPEFIRETASENAIEYNKAQEDLSAFADALFESEPTHGENKSVFSYQVKVLHSPTEPLIRLSFYEGVKVLAYFGVSGD